MLKTTQTCYFTVLEFRSPKIKVSSGYISFGGSTGESLPPPDPRGPLHSLAFGPCLHLQSQQCNIFQSLSLTLPPASIITSPSLTLLLLYFIKTLVITLASLR